ncbi:MAG: hypothetical protein KUL87_10010 [Pseudomonas sp.]|nr:hypothetical protein [Pseudomonas sp.]
MAKQKSAAKHSAKSRAVEGRLYSNKGTIIRLTFHAKSGTLFKVNPLMTGAAGWVRSMPPDNNVLPYQSSLAEIHDNTIIFLDETGAQVHSLILELREKIIGITSLVLYPDGSTWEGLIGENISGVKAMIWSPILVNSLKAKDVQSPWADVQDWKAVPTAMLIYPSENLMSCAQIEHSCCEPCK